jgi:glycosyltransferase involved in cell wall biosynthesis
MEEVLISVLHIIIDLNIGGAELMLKRLISSHHAYKCYRHSVISLRQIGKVGWQLQEMGVEVHAMDMRTMMDMPRIFWQLVKIIRKTQPNVIQTWMYHADLIGGLAARFAGNHRIIWGIRGSAIPQGRMSSTQIVVSLCSWLSRYIPEVIVCCAESARIAHVEKGYDQRKLVVIPNGYELSLFNRNPIFRLQVRDEFGISQNDLVVGIVGRFDPLKDHKNFVHAANLLASKFDNIKFLMIGRNIDRTNTVLKHWLNESGFAHKFVLAGERADISDCLSAMEIFCLSSSKEGFPNVVCEAMAMGVPCVVTSAGDAAEIVADTGIVVETRDSLALSVALQTMIGLGTEERLRLGKLARLRIERNYSIEKASSRFEDIYNRICQGISIASPGNWEK